MAGTLSLNGWHINSMGRYWCNFAARGPGEGLHPLRDPGIPEDAGDDA
ncbi:hypothetical protein [Streptomyces sp. NPDC057301]